MAEIAIPYTLVTPWGTLVFNDATGDIFRLTNITGLDMVALRADDAVEPKAQTDGAYIHNIFDDVRHITMEGYFRINSAFDSTGYRTARNAMEDDLIAALRSIRRADGTLSFTRTGGVLRSYTVRCDQAVSFTGEEGPVKSFIFGLVSAT